MYLPDVTAGERSGRRSSRQNEEKESRNLFENSMDAPYIYSRDSMSCLRPTGSLLHLSLSRRATIELNIEDAFTPEDHEGFVQCYAGREGL